MASQHNFSRPLLNATIPDKRVGTRSKFSPPPIFNVDNLVIFSLVGENAIFSNIDQGGWGIRDTAQVSQLLLAGIVVLNWEPLQTSQERMKSAESNRGGLIWPTSSVFHQKWAQRNLLAITFRREDPGNDRGWSIGWQSWIQRKDEKHLYSKATRKT